MSCSIGEPVEKVDLKRNLRQFYSPRSLLLLDTIVCHHVDVGTR